MKKLIALLTMFILLAVPTLVLAQNVGDIPLDILTPWTYFGSLTALAGLVLFITAPVVKWGKIQKKWLKRGVSWIIGIILGYVGWQFKWGEFIDVSWQMSLFYGFLAAIISNGVHGIPLVKGLLQYLKLEVKVD